MTLKIFSGSPSLPPGGARTGGRGGGGGAAAAAIALSMEEEERDSWGLLSSTPNAALIRVRPPSLSLSRPQTHTPPVALLRPLQPEADAARAPIRCVCLSLLCCREGRGRRRRRGRKKKRWCAGLWLYACVSFSKVFVYANSNDRSTDSLRGRHLCSETRRGGAKTQGERREQRRRRSQVGLPPSADPIGKTTPLLGEAQPDQPTTNQACFAARRGRG